jgi:hypothetical protein
MQWQGRSTSRVRAASVAVLDMLEARGDTSTLTLGISVTQLSEMTRMRDTTAHAALTDMTYKLGILSLVKKSDGMHPSEYQLHPDRFRELLNPNILSLTQGVISECSSSALSRPLESQGPRHHNLMDLLIAHDVPKLYPEKHSRAHRLFQ